MTVTHTSDGPRPLDPRAALGALDTFDVFDVVPVALAVLDVHGAPVAVNRRFRSNHRSPTDRRGGRVPRPDDRARPAAPQPWHAARVENAYFTII